MSTASELLHSTKRSFLVPDGVEGRRAGCPASFLALMGTRAGCPGLAPGSPGCLIFFVRAMHARLESTPSDQFTPLR